MNKATENLMAKEHAITWEINSIIEEVTGERIGFVTMIFTEGTTVFLANKPPRDLKKSLQSLMNALDQAPPIIPESEIIN